MALTAAPGGVALLSRGLRHSRRGRRRTSQASNADGLAQGRRNGRRSARRTPSMAGLSNAAPVDRDAADGLRREGAGGCRVRRQRERDAQILLADGKVTVHGRQQGHPALGSVLRRHVRELLARAGPALELASKVRRRSPKWAAGRSGSSEASATGSRCAPRITSSCCACRTTRSDRCSGALARADRARPRTRRRAQGLQVRRQVSSLKSHPHTRFRARPAAVDRSVRPQARGPDARIESQRALSGERSGHVPAQH